LYTLSFSTDLEGPYLTFTTVFYFTNMVDFFSSWSHNYVDEMECERHRWK